MNLHEGQITLVDHSIVMRSRDFACVICKRPAPIRIIDQRRDQVWVRVYVILDETVDTGTN